MDSISQKDQTKEYNTRDRPLYPTKKLLGSLWEEY